MFMQMWSKPIMITLENKPIMIYKSACNTNYE